MVGADLPTFELASVKLLRVVDLPEEGLPTRAMRGSRPIMAIDTKSVTERMTEQKMLQLDSSSE